MSNKKWLALLLLLQMTTMVTVAEVSKFKEKGRHRGHKKSHKRNLTFIETFTDNEKDYKEFELYCNELEVDRHSFQYPKHHGVHAQDCRVTSANEFDVHIDAKMLFTIIAIVTWGAFVRVILNAFEIPIPYTVILMISGLIIGTFSKFFCPQIEQYTAIARISSKVILYTFLPILIFESAFNIPVHKFYRSGIQILIIAFPGMVFCTFFVSGACYFFFHDYHWTFQQGNLFGSIISATDPVAVVAILRELGVSEVLSVNIEGESLLNDGVAILLFEIFIEFVEAAVPSVGHHEVAMAEQVKHISIQAIQIAVGGPVFGWAMAKITIFLLSYVYNDAPVEISATIVAAYLTYYIGEYVLGVSGVMAVVLLGLTIRGERTVISPDSEESVHHFWEILGYLANTILFVLVGIVMVQTGWSSISWRDVLYLLFLYIIIHVGRFIMLLMFYPILTRIGYGLTWQNMVVMCWGGLRGAVGICLALEVFRNEKLCGIENLGDKVLFQTCGIVFLTLCINGTTTKKLLDLLNLTEISTGRKEEMNNAVKRIHRVQGRWVRIFQLSSRMFDADWEAVHKNCHVVNPYRAKSSDEKAKPNEGALEAPHPVMENMTVCYNCNVLVQNEPTSEEYRDLTEDARSRVVKAMKIAYYKLFETGLISDLAVQVLIADAERVEDKYLTIIRAKNFSKYYYIRGFYPWLKKKLRRYEKDENAARNEKSVAKWRKPFRTLVMKGWFEWLILIIVGFNIAQIITELVHAPDCEGIFDEAFKALNVLFVFIYSLELFLKLMGYRVKEFFCDPWNYVDIAVLMLAYIDTTMTFLTVCPNTKSSLEESGSAMSGVKVVRAIRIIRIARLFKPMLPLLQQRISRKLNEQLFLGYDIARGFVHASEEVVKFIPQMIENGRVSRKVKNAVENEKTECLRTMAVFQQQHPGIAIAVKTRHACRSVLNTMTESLIELKDEGLLDDTEAELLKHFMETKMKRLWHSPTCIRPYSAHTLLGDILWLQQDDELYDLILDSVKVVSYSYGQRLSDIGEPPFGIYVIVAGLVKVSFDPTLKMEDERKSYGKIPNTELCGDVTYSHHEEDFFSTGYVMGEVGCLTKEPSACLIVAETSSIVYHVPLEVISEALQKFTDPYDSMESHMWRSVGIRRAMPLISAMHGYDGFTPERLHDHLLKSSVPLVHYDIFEVPPYVAEVVVIEGYAKNADTADIYIAPFVVPTICRRLHMLNNPVTKNRLLIVACDDVTLEQPPVNPEPNRDPRPSIAEPVGIKVDP